MGVRFDAVRLADLDERIRDGCSIRSSVRNIEEPVFTADRKWPGRVLASIVRYRPNIGPTGCSQGRREWGCVAAAIMSLILSAQLNGHNPTRISRTSSLVCPRTGPATLPRCCRIAGRLRHRREMLSKVAGSTKRPTRGWLANLRLRTQKRRRRRCFIQDLGERMRQTTISCQS